MTFREVRDMALMLIHGYSIAGEAIAPSYNNQQDQLSKLVSFVNDAVLEIATSARKIPAVARLSDLVHTKLPVGTLYTMPADFYQYISGAVTGAYGNILPTGAYRLMGSDILLARDADAVSIGYYRYPRRLDPSLPADTLEGTELDNAPETHTAAAYYAAAHLALPDDSFLYASLYNKYEDKLAKMAALPYAEIHAIGASVPPWDAACAY